MNIIEKLGIKPIQVYRGDDTTYFDGDEVRELEQQRNELLEALVGETLHTETSGHGWNQYANIELIEKIAGKSWEEIKELFNE